MLSLNTERCVDAYRNKTEKKMQFDANQWKKKVYDTGCKVAALMISKCEVKNANVRIDG